MNQVLEDNITETGKTETLFQEYAFSAFIRELTAVIRAKAVKANIHFTVNIDCNIPDRLYADITGFSRTLTGIFDYLLNNTAHECASNSCAGQKYISFCADLEELNNDIAKIKMEIKESGNGETVTLALTQKTLSEKKTAAVNNPENVNILVYEQRAVYAKSIVRTMENLGVSYKLVSGVSSFYRCLESKNYSLVILPLPLYDDVRIRNLHNSARVKFAVIAGTDEEIPKDNSSSVIEPLHSITVAGLLDGVSSGEGEKNADAQINGTDTDNDVMSGSSPFNNRNILFLFQKDAQEKIKEIKACADTGNIKLYTINMHALKSAAAIIGAERLSETAKTLENAGKRGDIDYIGKHTGEFISDLETVIREINKTLDGVSVKNENSAVNTDLLISELARLKNALNAIDLLEINSAADSLQKFILNKIPAEQNGGAYNIDMSVRAIIENKLTGNYDEAVSIIDTLMGGLDKGRQDG